MRVSEAGLALIRRAGAGGVPECLTQWSDTWRRFALVGGHVEPGETFRGCCVREVAEELELTDGADYRVAPEPVGGTVEYRAVSGSAGVETVYRVQVFPVDLLTPEASTKVDADPANRWLTAAEVAALTTRDGQPVSEQVRTVLARCGVSSRP